jgi:hypothetical protein
LSPTPTLLAQLFSLTPAESQGVFGILRGVRPKQLAERAREFRDDDAGYLT